MYKYLEVYYKELVHEVMKFYESAICNSQQVRDPEVFIV